MPRHLRLKVLVSLAVGVAAVLAVPALGSDSGLVPLATWGSGGEVGPHVESIAAKEDGSIVVADRKRDRVVLVHDCPCARRQLRRDRSARHRRGPRWRLPRVRARTRTAHRRRRDDSGDVSRPRSLRRGAGRRHGADRGRVGRSNPPLSDRRHRASGVGSRPRGPARARDRPGRDRLRRRRGQLADRDLRRRRQATPAAGAFPIRTAWPSMPRGPCTSRRSIPGSCSGSDPSLRTPAPSAASRSRAASRWTAAAR